MRKGYEKVDLVEPCANLLEEAQEYSGCAAGCTACCTAGCTAGCAAGCTAVVRVQFKAAGYDQLKQLFYLKLEIQLQP